MRTRIAALITPALNDGLDNLPAADLPKPTFQKPEDPELYFAFFNSHSAIDQQIQSSSAAAAAQLISTTAALYQVSSGDFPKITNEVRSFMAKLAVWQTQEQAYVAGQRASKKLPDMKTLVSYSSSDIAW